MQYQKSLKFLIITIVYFFHSSAFSSDHDSSDFLRSIFGERHEVNSRLYSIGQTMLEASKTEQEIFAFARKLQKGEVAGFEEPTPERLYLQMQGFAIIEDSKDNLHLRALHNLAVTQVDIAGLMVAKGFSPKALVVKTFYQDAWYFFSLAGYPASQTNMESLVSDNKIDFIIGNKKIEEKFRLRSIDPSINPSVNATFKKLEAEAEKKLRDQVSGANLILTDALLERARSNVRSYLQEAIQKLPDEAFGRTLEEEKASAAQMPTPEPLHFTPQIFSKLEALYLNLDIKVNNTVNTIKLNKDQAVPLLIFLGRSMGWPYEFYKAFQQKQKSNFDALHVLGSGLRTSKYTNKDLEAYKMYCDSLGLNKISKERPVLIVDAVETGQSLQTFSKILKDLYHFSNIQFLAVMLPGQTLNLPKSRVLNYDAELTRFLFAKHAEKAKFSLYPQFYPEQWQQWEKYLSSFIPNEEALALRQELLGLVEKEKLK